jgi:hypothetical protein
VRYTAFGSPGSRGSEQARGNVQYTPIVRNTEIIGNTGMLRKTGLFREAPELGRKEKRNSFFSLWVGSISARCVCARWVCACFRDIVGVWVCCLLSPSSVCVYPQELEVEAGS